MKLVGLIGGMGPEASAAYYRIMNREVRARLGGMHSARVLIDSLDFATLATVKTKSDAERVRRMLVESALRLEGAGATAIAIACNTVHRFAPSVRDALCVPLLHIADAAGKALDRDGHRCVGLLGTRPTMQSSFYQKRLEERFGLQVLVPTPASQKRVHERIESELARGDTSPGCLATLDAATAELAEGGASAVLLACTELGVPFGFQSAVVERALPLYDTAFLHASAIVDFALDASESRD